MKFDSIDEIRNHPWVGVYRYDLPAIKAAEAYALDTTNSPASRAEALRCIIRDAFDCSEDILLTRSDEFLLRGYLLALATQKSGDR